MTDTSIRIKKEIRDALIGMKTHKRETMSELISRRIIKGRKKQKALIKKEKGLP